MKSALPGLLASLSLLGAMPAAAAVAITEVAPWSSGNSSVGEDGFVLTYTCLYCGAAHSAAPTLSIDSSKYRVIGNHMLDRLSERGLEASAVTYARNRGSFFFAGDEGLGVVEISHTVQTGPTVGNVGTEGISYDPRDASFVSVKQDDPGNSRLFVLGPAAEPDTYAMMLLGLAVLGCHLRRTAIRTRVKVIASAG